MRLARRGLVQRSAVLAAAAFTLIPAAPGFAHGPAATDYRTQITAVDPPVRGLTVRIVDAGAQIEVTNHTGQTVEVPGYAGEPYLDIRPDGVWQNQRSPATYLNATATGAPAPSHADPRAAPQWRRIATTPVARWHDHRSHWMSVQLPPAVAADPGHAHHLSNWRIPLRLGSTTVQVTGTLDWLPPPQPEVWWSAILVTVAALSLLGVVPTRRAYHQPAASGWLAVIGVVSVASGLAALVYTVAQSLDDAPPGLGGLVLAATLGQVFTLPFGVAAIGAGMVALRRYAAADLALTVTGGLLALIVGGGELGVFSHPVTATALPAAWARALVAAILAGSTGTTVAAGLHLRAANAAARANATTG